jgi:uncharacterized protein YecT (DUF1311 family)
MKTKHERSWALAFCGMLIVAGLTVGQKSPGQQGPTAPKKALTPEQKIFQQQGREYMNNRQSLQAQAKQIFDAERARENAGDCRNAQTTIDINICFGKQGAITEQTLKSYEGIIQRLMAPAPRMPGGARTEMPRPGGPALTPKELSDEFERVEKAWREYRETACTAAFHQFSGGTGGPSFEGQCELTLTRDHMRELDMIYGGAVHR